MKEEEGNEEEEWKGKKLLTMAGIFDCWQPPNGGDPLYTYTIITVNASKAISFIHNRQVRLAGMGYRAYYRAAKTSGKYRKGQTFPLLLSMWSR